MKEIIQVQGMSCTSSVNSIEGSVGEVTVEFDNAQTTVALVKATIEEQGYNVI